MKKRLPLIIFIVVLIIAIIAGVVIFLNTRQKFNEGYVSGNTPGNLYNQGLVCEYDEFIYFANPSDRDRLYRMNLDGSNLTKISDDTVSYINADENYIYYVRNNPGTGDTFSFMNFNTDSLCRLDRDGDDSSVLVLDEEPSLYASLVGNYIYYLHYSESNGSVLYKVKIDGSELGQVGDSPFFTASTCGQYLYFNGVQSEHYLWRLNSEDDTMGMIYGGNCWMPTVVDNSTVYYMDCDNNYAIAKVDLETEKKVFLAENRADFYNLHGDYIYLQYANGLDESALCRMRTDGSDFQIVVKGVYRNLCTTSEHIYFRDSINGQSYRVPHDDITHLEFFEPGAVENDD